ncbi:MAG TPA: hypothetical protein VGB66_17540 [Longimicrobium sp.]|jgi:hypothetical protein
MADTTGDDQIITMSQGITITRALYGAETTSIENTEYDTPVDQERDMLDSRNAYEKAMGLLTAEQNDKPEADPDREGARELLWKVARTSVQLGIQSIKNMRLRAQYFQNIADEVTQLRSQIDQGSVAEVEDLAARAMKIRDVQLALYRAQLSPTSLGFKDWMQGKTLVDLQRIYTEKRFPGQSDFSALSEENKLLVYGDVVEASGRSTAFTTLLSDSKQYLKGGPFILLTIGITVWQIANDANPVTTVVENALDTAASMAGAVVGEAVGAAIGAAGGPIGMLVGGIIGGLVGGFLGGWASDHLFEATVGAFSGSTTGPDNQPLFVTPFKYQFAVPDNFKLTQSLLSQTNAGSA